MKTSIKTLFIVTGLAIGGAEIMLFRLLSRLDPRRFTANVISLKGPGPVQTWLENCGIPVYTLGWNSLWEGPRALKDLICLIEKLRPDVVQGWMVHANAAALIRQPGCRDNVPVLWSIRHSLHERNGESRTTNSLIRLLGYCSSWPKRIVYNSRTSACQHEALGYDSDRTVIIPNGFDCDFFRPRPDCRLTIRQMLGLAGDVPVIGMLARVHPSKDHPTFFDAAMRLSEQDSRTHFLIVGRGTDHEKMRSAIAARGLSGRVHALGERTDVPELLSCVDIATSSSMAEAFPNAIGEAMSCGVPCVTTDVGDSSFIVGDTGRVVPRENPRALAEAWRELIEIGPENRAGLGAAARYRIRKTFSLHETVRSYQQLYSELLPS